MTTIPEDVDFLKHHGVKGMRWGKRKSASPATPTKPRNKTQKINDEFAFGTKGSERVGKRMEAGRSLGSARRRETARQAGQVASVLGVTVGALLGPSVMQAGLNKAVISGRAANGARMATKLFSDTNGIANHKTVNLAFDAATKTWG